MTTTQESGLRSAQDELQAAFALGQGRVIVTHDRDFLRLHAAGVPHAGIAYCDKDRKSIGEIILRLIQLWERIEAKDMVARVQFL